MTQDCAHWFDPPRVEWRQGRAGEYSRDSRVLVRRCWLCGVTQTAHSSQDGERWVPDE